MANERPNSYFVIASKAERHKIRAAYDQATENGLDPILIKGWSISRFYDSEVPRLSNDIDLVVASRSFQAASVWVNKVDEPGLSIDLHCGFGDRDLLPWEVLYERSRLVDLDGVAIRVLSDEDNLRLTAAHWLIDGGVYEEKLKDIYYLVKNRKADFDWDLCLNAAGPVRRTWVLTAIATARDHLELDVSGLPEEIRNFRLPRWYKSVLEKEWKLGPYPRIPVKIAYKRPKVLLEQIRRRFPPNAIAATCDTESPFDDAPRWPLQLKSLRKRALNKF